MKTDKLFADIKALLQAAGMSHITMRTGSQGALVSANHEDGTGAVFYVTPNSGDKAAKHKVLEGARAADATTADVVVMPSSAALHAHIVADLVGSAKLLGIEAETLRRLVAPAPR